MKTSSFLVALRSHASLPLVFRAGRETVAPGYHLTEVKRVTYETMDCGAMSHRWSETQFEIWVPAVGKLLPDRGNMPADKFLRIIDRVETELPLDGEAVARIHTHFPGQPAALYDVEAVTAHEGKLWVALGADETRCKAAERRMASATDGCCGSSNSEEEGAGCHTVGKNEGVAACCA